MIFDNTYARELEGFYTPCQPETVPAPKLLQWNQPLADELGLADGLPAADIFSGNQIPPGAMPLAQAYAGHQFGGFVPQLGDGRAILLGEVIDRHGQRRDIQLKGSGRTPFSRGGDGKAAVGPVLREYVMGEAMHALGIPTTRALAAVATGEPVYRERPLPGAVLARVAASHLRVGTFQFFAARRETDKVRQLADYAIARHYPQAACAANPYLAFLQAVVAAQASLLARWMLAGFIHGVMNTDNMSISGETIDYGPCAFLDTYHPHTVFSSIDHQGRYAYGNQPLIARWNLARLAETLLPLIDLESATAAVEAFTASYDTHWLAGMRDKLGLEEPDLALSNGFLALLAAQRVDYTLAFRYLKDPPQLRALFADPAAYDTWALGWQPTRPPRNPTYIPRNHLVEAALTAAVERADLGPFEQLLSVLRDPYGEHPDREAYAQPSPDGNAGYRTFCGT
ncbi:MAG: YdiU family protein [Bryobacteraceae bacterium]|nr:YdiU family protein [Bryobacteraceae bacterium]